MTHYQQELQAMTSSYQTNYAARKTDRIVMAIYMQQAYISP
ncbi:hypothetical protein P4S52_16525 [Vibrio sp. SA48]